MPRARASFIRTLSIATAVLSGRRLGSDEIAAECGGSVVRSLGDRRRPIDAQEPTSRR